MPSAILVELLISNGADANTIDRFGRILYKAAGSVFMFLLASKKSNKCRSYAWINHTQLVTLDLTLK